MAIRKNPDWSVWVADVWHWARQPPGIYIVTISLMACALLYAFSPPRQQVVYQPPVTSQPRSQPVQRQPVQEEPFHDVCAEGAAKDLFGQPCKQQQQLDAAHGCDSTRSIHWRSTSQMCEYEGSPSPNDARLRNLLQERENELASGDIRCNLAGTVFSNRLQKCIYGDDRCAHLPGSHWSKYGGPQGGCVPDVHRD